MTLSIHRDVGLDILQMNYLLFSDSANFSIPANFVDMPDGSKIGFTIDNSKSSVYHFIKILPSGSRQSLMVNMDQLDSTERLKFLFFPLYLLERQTANMHERLRKIDATYIRAMEWQENFERELNEIKSYSEAIEMQTDEINENSDKFDGVMSQSKAQLIAAQKRIAAFKVKDCALNKKKKSFNLSSLAKSLVSGVRQATTVLHTLFSTPLSVLDSPISRFENEPALLAFIRHHSNADNISSNCSSSSQISTFSSSCLLQSKTYSMEDKNTKQEGNIPSWWGEAREKFNSILLLIVRYIKFFWQCIFLSRDN